MLRRYGWQRDEIFFGGLSVYTLVGVNIRARLDIRDGSQLLHYKIMGSMDGMALIAWIARKVWTLAARQAQGLAQAGHSKAQNTSEAGRAQQASPGMEDRRGAGNE